MMICRLVILAASSVLCGYSQYFSDIYSTYPFSGTVNRMYLRGITAGCATNPLQYCPERTLKRWEAAVFIIRSLYSAWNSDGEPDRFPYSPSPYFPADVPYFNYDNPELTPNGHPAFKYIQKLRELGITSGCTAVRFCEGDELENYQIAIFTVRARQLRNGQQIHVPVCDSNEREYNAYMESCTDQYFSDVSSSVWYFPYVQQAFELTGGSLLTDYCPAAGGTRFCPELPGGVMHRGDMSTYVVYGIWGQPAIAPDYYGGYGGGALPAFDRSASCNVAQILYDSKVVSVTENTMYVSVATQAYGSDFMNWRLEIKDAELRRDGTRLFGPENRPLSTGRREVRFPDMDPGRGRLTTRANFKFESDCGAIETRSIDNPFDVPFTSSVTPSSIFAGETNTQTVTVSGENLAPTSGYIISGTTSTAQSIQLQPVNATNYQLRFTLPAEYTARTMNVYTSVAIQYGHFLTKPVGLSVVDGTPLITSVSPDPLPPGATTTVVISGSNFGTQRPTLQVTPAGIATTVLTWSQNQITAAFSVPSTAAGQQFDVKVISAGTLSSGFAAGSPPQTSNSSNSKVIRVTGQP